MFSAAWLTVTSLKAIIEIAALSFMGQGFIAVIAGKNKHGNFVYRIFTVITSPIISMAKIITPRFIPNSYAGIVSTLLLLCLWLALVIAKVYLCHTYHPACFST